MKDHKTSVLDRPEILNFVFYPRPSYSAAPPPGARDIEIPTADGEKLGARFYPAAPENPHILFFHGNGEIADDYDMPAQAYNSFGLNLLVADYRGYGKSTGSPGISAMLSDAHAALDSAIDLKERENRPGPLWIMGRSLGSAPAVELAASRPRDISGLVIESGFASTVSLLSRLGINPRALGIDDSSVFSNADKIAQYKGPLLIIHGRQDQIIPPDHAETLYKSSSSAAKDLKVIKGADHNSLMIVAGKEYFRTLKDFIYKH